MKLSEVSPKSLIVLPSRVLVEVAYITLSPSARPGPIYLFHLFGGMGGCWLMKTPRIRVRVADCMPSVFRLRCAILTSKTVVRC